MLVYINKYEIKKESQWIPFFYFND